jgi:hypothetical protein
MTQSTILSGGPINGADAIWRHSQRKDYEGPMACHPTCVLHVRAVSAQHREGVIIALLKLHPHPRVAAGVWPR